MDGSSREGKEWMWVFVDYSSVKGSEAVAKRRVTQLGRLVLTLSAGIAISTTGGDCGAS